MNHNPPFKLFELLIFKLILFSFCEWGLYLGVVVIVIVMLLLPLCYCSFSVAETSLVATEKHSVLVVRSVFLLYFAPFFSSFILNLTPLARCSRENVMRCVIFTVACCICILQTTKPTYQASIVTYTIYLEAYMWFKFIQTYPRCKLEPRTQVAHHI